MNSIKERFANIESLMKEASMNLEINNMESLIRVIQIQNEIGISFYNNEIQLRLIDLFNTELLQNTSIVTTLDYENSNTYDVNLKIEDNIISQIEGNDSKLRIDNYIISKIDLLNKNFYFMKDIDSEISNIYLKLSRDYQSLLTMDSHMTSIDESLSREKLKFKLLQSKRKLDNYEEAIDIVKKKKKYFENSLKDLEEKLNKKFKLKSILEKEISLIIEKFRNLGFEIMYLNEKIIKTFTIYNKITEEDNLISCPSKELNTYSNAYYEDQYIAIFNDDYFCLDDLPSLNTIIFNNETMIKIEEIIKEKEGFLNVSSEISDNGETKNIYFFNKAFDVKYDLNNEGKITIKGKHPYFYYLMEVGLIEKIAKFLTK